MGKWRIGVVLEYWWGRVSVGLFLGQRKMVLGGLVHQYYWARGDRGQGHGCTSGVVLGVCDEGQSLSDGSGGQEGL